MSGIPENPELSKAEKVVGFLVKIPLGLLCGLAWVIRKIKKPYWDR